MPASGRRWLMWGIPAFVFLIAFFHRPVPGLIARELMQSFGATGTLVGLLAATYFYAYAGFMLPGGLLIDAYGARRVVGAGSAVMGVGALLMAAAASPAALFIGRFVVGLGASVTFVGALKIATAWFPPSAFGTLSALTATAGVLGSLAATAPLAWLVTVMGWRGALACVGVATLLGAAACLLVVRDRPPATVGAAPSPSLGAVLRGTRDVLGNPHTWPPFLAFFCLYAVAGNLMLWVVPYLRDVYGLGTGAAALYASATATALLIAAPLTGVVSDRVVRGRKLPYVVLTVAQLAVWVVFVASLGTLPLAGVYTMLFLLGLTGGNFVLIWPLGREVNPPPLAGVAVAVVNLGGFFGAAVTQGPLGLLLDARWAGLAVDGARVYPVEAYRAVFGACAVFVLVAAALAACFRETGGRNIYADLRRGPTRTHTRR